MIQVSVEVRGGAALFRMAVWAESISRAVSIVKGRHPAHDVRVVFPIDPERFFLGDSKRTEENGGEGRQLRPLQVPSTKS